MDLGLKGLYQCLYQDLGKSCHMRLSDPFQNDFKFIRNEKDAIYGVDILQWPPHKHLLQIDSIGLCYATIISSWFILWDQPLSTSDLAVCYISL